jgi:hypothetical protein
MFFFDLKANQLTYIKCFNFGNRSHKYILFIIIIKPLIYSLKNTAAYLCLVDISNHYHHHYQIKEKKERWYERLQRSGGVESHQLLVFRVRRTAPLSRVERKEIVFVNKISMIQEDNNKKQQMDVFTRDKVFSIRSLLWSSSNLRSNGCCSHSRTWRVIEKKKEDEERTRKSRNIRRRLYSQIFSPVLFFFRSSGCAFVFSLNFTAVDNLFVCLCACVKRAL